MLTDKFFILPFGLFLTMVATTNAQTTIDQPTATPSNTAVRITNDDQIQVVIMVPNVTCYGRFHDSLKEHIQSKHDWVHDIRIRDTKKVRKPRRIDTESSKGLLLKASESLPFDIGTIAELTFTIDSSKSALDLLKVIRDSKQYSLKGWTVQIEVAVDEMLLE